MALFIIFFPSFISQKIPFLSHISTHVRMFTTIPFFLFFHCYSLSGSGGGKFDVTDGIEYFDEYLSLYKLINFFPTSPGLLKNKQRQKRKNLFT